MPPEPFLPIVYLKKDCPHCLKLRIFLLEAGLRDAVDSRSFAPGDAQEAALRAELGAHLDKVSFPAAQTAPGVYLAESDAIIAWLAAAHGIDTATLPVFTTYAGAVLPQYGAARREIADLKARLEA